MHTELHVYYAINHTVLTQISHTSLCTSPHRTAHALDPHTHTHTKRPRRRTHNRTSDPNQSQLPVSSTQALTIVENEVLTAIASVHSHFEQRERTVSMICARTSPFRSSILPRKVNRCKQLQKLRRPATTEVMQSDQTVSQSVSQLSKNAAGRQAGRRMSLASAAAPLRFVSSQKIISAHAAASGFRRRPASMRPCP